MEKFKEKKIIYSQYFIAFLDVLGFNPQKQRKKLAFKVGTVFGQMPQMWYHLPPIDTFNLFSKIFELDRKEYKKRLAYLIKMFAIEPFLRTPVRKLSLGQRMRCELVASLLHNPKVLFLDEPTAGLDPVASAALHDDLGHLLRRSRSPAAEAGGAPEAKHDCKGKNACKGQGGCKSGDNGCAGKNSCKGKGGCAVPPHAMKSSKDPQ